MINEKGEIVAWRLCQTKANAEITELLMGIRRRHEALGLPMPEMMVTDNCCQVRRAVESALPEADCILDMWHFIARYVAVILNSGKNTYRAAVAADITNAVLKKRSVKGSGAEYWSKAEQEQRLEAAFTKWAGKGTVWSAAAIQVHKEQLNHVRKGCLERRRQDIPSDGSRIEGSHKGWNSLQRVQPSGITVLVALGHDFVLRRNIRVAYGCASAVLAHGGGLKLESPFLTSTHGSHHISLIPAIASLHNEILKNNVSSGLERLPELAVIPSGETFGLIFSDHTSTFGGLIDVKEELTELDDAVAIHSLEFEHDATADLALQASRPILEGLNINPQLLNQPATDSPSAVNVTTAAKRKSESVLHVDRVGGATLTTTLTTTTSPTIKDPSVEAAPADSEAVPPVAKRARLGSRSQLSDSEPEGQTPHCAMPAVAESDTSRPGHLNYYFKARTAHVSARATPVNAPKPTSTCGIVSKSGSFPSRCPTSTGTGIVATTGFPSASTPRPQASASAESHMLPRCRVDGLTRSQRLFSLATNIDARALVLSESGEFYLFMDMRAESKWVSHEMTSKRWVEATAEYNKRLVAKCGPTAVLKHPLALLRKLGELEPRLMNRITKGHYASKRNSEVFWKKHCNAVVLIKPEAEGASKKVRKAQTCSRCQTIMYPGSEGSSLNHKRAYCSDGVRQVSKAGDEVPPWPQPQGIFTAGKTFHPQVFYVTVQDIYERYCIPGAESLPFATMEAIAFAKLLASRIRMFDGGMVGLRLFADYELDPKTPTGCIIRPEDGSGEWLRLGYLQGGIS
ncbi:hypothetical protein L210DRAFT_3570273 [Boletus edulis BED1]|uniref:Uncharacterized protein n=1 Tax=Boletus edulis BED1 TaxID=1328754 RepID=A0AAD4BDU8_BOLED|nr:hypothetical protein L210DRAFT_3570273 [Boletus edulis BED1]